MFRHFYKIYILLIWISVIQCVPTIQVKSNQNNKKPLSPLQVTTSNRNTSVWTDNNEFGDGDKNKPTESFQCNFYNELLKDFIARDCFINLEIENEKIGIYQTDGVYYYYISFTDNQRRELIESLEKYIKWEDIAVKKKEKVDKEIGTVGTNVKWGIQNQSYIDTQRGEMTLNFFSQNIYRHQLVLSYPKFKSDYGGFNSPPMYLEKDSVKILHNLLQDKSINESILKIEKQIHDQNESYQ